MSYTNRKSSPSVRAVIDRFGFPHVMAVTVLLLAGTILLGVATRHSGAGLACDQNWPLCDGGLLNLFPAGFPSFFEWIHRVVAGVAGVFIVGTALAAWLGAVDDRRISWLLTIGMVLTPVQVLLGRETVNRYEMLILDLHFWMAILIFVLFVAAAVLVWADRLTMNRLSYALGLTALTIPIHVLLSPVVVSQPTTVLETVQYGVTLLLIAVTVATAVGGWKRVSGRFAIVLAATPALVISMVYFGRDAVISYDPTAGLVYLGLTATTFIVLLACALLARHARQTSPTPTQ